VKRLLLAAVLFAVAAPVFAIQRTVVMVDEVIRMSKAGVGDDEIIAYIRKNDQAFDVTGDDVIAMTEANVSKAVIKEVIDESSARMQHRSRRSQRSRTYARLHRRALVLPLLVRPVLVRPATLGQLRDAWLVGLRLLPALRPLRARLASAVSAAFGRGSDDTTTGRRDVERRHSCRRFSFLRT
jgi:hypothetical protein